ILNAGRLMLDKIGTLMKAQYRAEKIGKIGTILCRLAPNYMTFHLVGLSFVRRHKKEWGLRYLLASLMIAVSVTLAGICLTLYPAFLQDAKSYSPYDMVYSEIYGMNQVPLQDVIHILEKNGVAVEQIIRLPYIRDDVFNYFPVTEINRDFGCDYQIQEGQFLNLFQYDLEDGYEHNIQPVSAVTISGDRKLRSVGTDVKILFNQNPTFADKTLIINDSDFAKLRADTPGGAGIANLFQFQNWEDSYAGVSGVKEYLHENNPLDENEQLYYEISSKVEKYQDAEKSGEFLLFLMAFVIGLIIMAAFLLIHSCIQTEKEENSRAVCSLRLLGMTDKEIVKCLCYKNFLRFIPPAVVGTILSFLPSYYLNESYGMGTNGILAGIVFGVILAIGIFVVIRRYSEKEVKIY
ncbi:MAG: ABC transporter permease, partial [Clostridiales bacterium]|nr:ABC transporter permease [Clostridiales bacterium]